MFFSEDYIKLQLFFILLKATFFSVSEIFPFGIKRFSISPCSFFMKTFLSMNAYFLLKVILTKYFPLNSEPLLYLKLQVLFSVNENNVNNNNSINDFSLQKIEAFFFIN